MTLPEFALAYKKCTKEELRQFVGHRTGHLPSKARKKPQLIDKLEKLDADATFHFMDLPPELRTIIYREVVSLKSPEVIREEENMTKKVRARIGHRCFPAILATNSLIHSEARDVMYGDQDVSVKFQFQNQHACAVDCYDRVHFTTFNFDMQRGFDWADFLKQIYRLRIDIDMRVCCLNDRAEVSKFANRLLYGLATHVTTSKRLKDVAVHLSLCSVEKDEGMTEKMLWPLARLTKDMNFTVTGTHDEETLSKISTHLTTTGSPTSTYKSMKQYHQLLSRATALMEAKKDADFYVTDILEGRYEQLRSLVKTKDSIDDLYEQMMIFAVKKLEETMSKSLMQRCMSAALQRAERLYELRFEMMDDEELAEFMD